MQNACLLNNSYYICNINNDKTRQMNKITNEELKAIFELGALCQSLNERIDSLEDAFFFKHKFKQATRQFQRELDSLHLSIQATVKNPIEDLNYYPRKIDEVFNDLIITDDGEQL